MIPKLYNRHEVAEVLRVTVKTIHEWVRDGKLRSTKIGGWKRYFTEEHINEFIKNGEA